MTSLLQAVRRYAAAHATADGLATTCVPGLRMMCVPAPSGPMHSIYRPLVCLVLQGAKRMSVHGETREVHAGDSVLVSADVPVTGRIVQASPAAPYCAVAQELDLALLAQLCVELPLPPLEPGRTSALSVQDGEAAVLDCVTRLMGLIERPEAVPLLQPGIARELHYWLLAGSHGPALRRLAAPDGYASRLGEAMRLLRTEYRTAISVERLAAAARMSVSAFHRHFRALTSLAPLQFQKQLRLVEARRLMRDLGLPASAAAFEVGYQSVPQFTREYARMFGAPPMRDTRGLRRRLAEPAAPQA